ncbi:MAG TPA: twin-arginine translocase TatA/TatE family subunit [Candidatus Angelobacter sp.]|nr:twin-arginine translocase TatA/TatE family subunit [Candidatus Angelobacter sp.]
MNFGVSGEMVFLAILALVLFGPRRLPEIARTVGRFMAEFKRASNEFQNQIHDEIRKLDFDEPPKTIGAGEIVSNGQAKASTGGATDTIVGAIERLTDRIKNIPQE